ncbi:MAG: hypothetical protein JWQ02_2487 [Capsulimonas sp.]|jgi:hypothetical protein|nr:hypothetical protein [Capsulimonas sp.]
MIDKSEMILIYESYSQRNGWCYAAYANGDVQLIRPER